MTTNDTVQNRSITSAVWFGRTDRSIVTAPALAMLSPQERARMQRYRVSVAAERFAVRRITVRRIIAAQSRCRPQDVIVEQHCPGCGSDEHGPAIANGMRLSLSSSGNIMILATSPTGPIGVDVELADHRSPNVPPWICHPKEQQAHANTPSKDHSTNLLRMWVAKEADTKALGLGLRVPFATVLVEKHGRTLTATAPKHPTLQLSELTIPKSYGPVIATVASTDPIAPMHLAWEDLP